MPAWTKPRTTLSAPCLVRVKIRARSIASRRNTSIRIAGLAARSTRITRCSTRSTVEATGVTATLTGSRSMCAASSAMARGMVAENISVCRSAGSFATILRMSWMKPMSSIRSASSRTRHSTSPRRSALLLTRSSSRPGVATRTSTPLSSARTCAPIGTPPIASAARDAQMAAVSAEAVEDLAGQLARRAEHQDAAALAHRRPRAGGEPMQDRQRECGGLAGPGLGDADHVAARHDGRNCLRLDRSRGEVLFLGECACDGVVKSEVVKGGQ